MKPPMEEYNLFQSIFPVFHLIKNEKGNYADGEFLGTCFFCELSGYRFFVSAAHVLKRAEDETGDLVFFYNKGHDKPVPIVVTALIVENIKQDFAFLIASKKMESEHKDFLVPIKVSKTNLVMGQEVFTLGFPLTYKEKLPQLSTTININPMLFKGYVHTRWDNISPKKFKTIYPLSFQSIEGISGAPLLATIDGKPRVFGIMHDKWSLGRQLIEEEETESDGIRTIVKLYSSTEMAISSDFKPFEEIEEFLRKNSHLFN